MTVRTWVFLAGFCLAAACTAATLPEATNVFESPVALAPETQIDKLVFAQLTRLKLQPVFCSDAVFVRRVYLDVIGTLPTAKEARDFIEDTDAANKRRLLIDRLLERDEFADYWAMKWGDVLRIKAEFPVNLWPNAAQAYHRWVRASLAANKPYDRFVRELLTSSGSNFRVGPVNFYRAIQNRTPEGIARAVALTFMGTRAESWPTNRLAGLAVFFSQIAYKPSNEWKEEHVYWDPLGTGSLPGNTAPGQASIAAIAQPSNNIASISVAASTNAAALAGQGSSGPFVVLATRTVPLEAVFPDGSRVKLGADRDPREVFANWLTSAKNPWFSRSIVNRVWAWLLGRGIIHEADDIREDNPPSNPALLEYLEKEMVAGNYDLKHLYRIILNSQTYQFASVPQFDRPEAEANFATYKVRRLEAEVLIDAINKVTGSSDLYTSPIPEPFTYIPKGMPAVSIADGSITSPFLALFGRSARATGMENERNNKPTPAQWLYLLNSTEIQRKLEQGPRLQAVLGSGLKPPRLTEELYLAILSRFPSPEEVQTIGTYGIAQPAKRIPPGKTNTVSKATPAPSPAETTNSASAAATNRPAGTNSGASLSAARPDMPDRSGGSDQLKTKAPSKPIPKRRDDWIDIAWALINSEEFLYRH